MPYYFTHVWNLMNKLNKSNRDRFIDTVQGESSGEGLQVGVVEELTEKEKREKELIEDFWSGWQCR